MCELKGVNHALLLKVRQGPHLHELHRRFKLMECFSEIRKWNLTILTSTVQLLLGIVPFSPNHNSLAPEKHLHFPCVTY